MNTSPKMACRRVMDVALVAGTLLVCLSFGHADAASAGTFGLRNQNPFLQVFGLPLYQPAYLTRTGTSSYVLILDLANHADAGQSPVERFGIDGETYFFTLAMRRRAADWLEVGLDVPFVAHTDGFMDHMIRAWHNALGISNSKRPDPDNQLGFRYGRDNEQLFALDSPTSGLGDIQLSVAIPIRKSLEDKAAITLRSSLKLPTGDPGRLLGSGAADFAIGLYAANIFEIRNRDIHINALAGVLLLGDGDVLPALQRDAVVFSGAAASCQVNQRIAMTMQVYGQDSYYRSNIEELGGKSLQLALGMDYRTRRGTLMRFAIVEDVFANATTDFALHISAIFDGDEP